MVSIPSLSSTSAEETPTADGRDAMVEDGRRKVQKSLDIVFLQDTTGSQGAYIKAARQAIRDICDKISSSAQFPKELIRFGLIAFRDHPPQDATYVTKNFGFTSSIEVMQKNLTNLVATGGGDGPEAQTAALAAALNLEWEDDAIKVVILITDAPPHGLGESADGFDKSPDQNDPLDMARQMAERGVTLFVVACEPTLSSGYMHALDFYSALVQITSGRLLPLLMADKLGDYIVASAVETIETEQLISEFEYVIIDDVYAKAKPLEEVMAEVQQTIQNRGTQLQTMEIENVYNESEQATKNREAWFAATTIGEARSKVQPVAGRRMKPEFADSLPIRHYESPVYGTSTVMSMSMGSMMPVAVSERERESAIRGRGAHPYSTVGGRGGSTRTRSAKRQPVGSGSDDEESSPSPGPSDAESLQRMHQMRMVMMMQARSMGMTSSGPPQPQPAYAQQQQQQQLAMLPASGSMVTGPPVVAQQMQMMQQGSMASMAQPAQQQQQQQPKLTLERSNFSMSQAHRLVMQSLTRNSKVTATGLVSKSGETAGQQVSIGPYKEM